jgi:hypothetical protein
VDHNEYINLRHATAWADDMENHVTDISRIRTDRGLILIGEKEKRFTIQKYFTFKIYCTAERCYTVCNQCPVIML